MGYRLRMSGEIHDWLADLHDSDPVAAMLTGQALAALIGEGASLGPPLVVPAAATWPEAADRSVSQQTPRRCTRKGVPRHAASDVPACSAPSPYASASRQTARTRHMPVLPTGTRRDFPLLARGEEPAQSHVSISC